MEDLYINENIKLFGEKLANNKELQEKFKQVKDPDEAYALAASIQDGFTKEEFINTMLEVQKRSRDLTDEDLEQVAGGLDAQTRNYIASGLLLAVCGAAAAA